MLGFLVCVGLPYVTDGFKTSCLLRPKTHVIDYTAVLCSQDTVSIVLFNVLPQMVDIVISCSYLAARMEPWVAIIVLITVSSYVPLTVGITERRGKVSVPGISVPA